MRSSTNDRIAFRNSMRERSMCSKNLDCGRESFWRSMKNLPTGHTTISSSFFLTMIFSFKTDVQILLLHFGCDRLGGSHLSRQHKVFLETADSDNDFIRDLVQFHVLFTRKRHLSPETIDPNFIGETVGFAHEKALQWVPLAVDLGCKRFQTLVPEDFILEEVYGQDGDGTEILPGRLHVVFLAFLPGLEIGVFDFRREHTVHDDGIDVHPVKAEIHECPLSLLQNDVLRVGKQGA